jgi:hypothetical protein
LRRGKQPTNGQPPPAVISNGPKASSWVMMAAAILIGVLLAIVLLNLLGRAVGAGFEAHGISYGFFEGEEYWPGNRVL